MIVLKGRVPQLYSMAIRMKSNNPLRKMTTKDKLLCRQPSKKEVLDIPWKVLRKKMNSKLLGKTSKSMELSMLLLIHLKISKLNKVT